MANLIINIAAALLLFGKLVHAECHGSADIQFLLDSSGSMGAGNFRKQLDFVRNFVKTFEIGPNDVRIGLATFSSKVNNEFFFNDYDNKTELLNAINKVKYTAGLTLTDRGMKFVREKSFKPTNGERPNAPNILIVTTDGNSTLPDLLKKETDLIHKTNINVFTIGIGNTISLSELQMIASSPNNVYQVSDFNALVNVTTGLKNITCAAPGPPGCQNKPADIHFLLDVSRSVGRWNFPKQMEFVRNFVKHFPVGPNNVRFGLTTFSTNVSNKFFMNAYDNEMDLLNAIDNVKYTKGGLTLTGMGLADVRKKAFTTAHGDRTNAPNILIVTTDGQSTRRYNTKIEAELLHKANIKTFAIGIGDRVNQEELKLIASDASHVYNVASFEALEGIQQSLQLTTCNDL